MLKRILHIFRNFLFGTANREFLIFLFFLALSGAFWLTISLNDTYEQDIAVPVRLVGVPRQVVITDDLPDTIKVTVRDKGFTMLTYLYGNEIRPIQFKYSSYANEQTMKGVVPVADLQKALYAQLYSSSKIVAIKTDGLEFGFNYGQHKRVPIRLYGDIKFNRSFYLAHSRFWPEYVTVYGSKKQLDSIQYVTTQYLKLSNLEDTVYQIVNLKKIRGVKIKPMQVKVGLYPDIMTEESMEVKIEAINMPTGKMLRTFPSKVKVSFVVGASQYRNIHPEDFKVVADYNDFGNTPSDKCTIYIKKAPKYIRHLRLSIDQVDYLIEENG